jgi:hypothetical protein
VAAVATRQAITAKTAAAKSDRSDRANPSHRIPGRHIDEEDAVCQAALNALLTHLKNR